MSHTNRFHAREPGTYQDDVLKEAVAICRNRLARDSRQPRLLHLSGLLAARNGLVNPALAYLKRAITLAPSRVDYYNDLSKLLSHKGRADEAIAADLAALALAPATPRLYRRLGRTLYQHRRFSEARTVYQEAVRLAPDPLTYRGLGDVLHSQGLLREAVDHYEMALRLDSSDVEGYCRLGRAHLRSGNLNLALTTFRRGLQLQDDSVDLHVGVGDTLIRLDLPDEAVRAYTTALTIAPTDVNASRRLVCALEAFGPPGETVGAWLSFGMALENRGRFLEAVAAYRQALARKPDCLRAFVSLGRVQLAIGEPQEAIRHLRAALALDPEHRLAHVDLGLASYHVGDVERAWDEFAWYYNEESIKWRAFEQPVWDGSHLGGRTILLWTDQGLGDTIQFLRYVNLVRDLGARVIVECHHRGLVQFVERMAGVERVLVPGAPLPAFDVHAPLVFFPTVLQAGRTPLSSSVPYLSVDPRLTRAWHRRLVNRIS